MSIFKKEYDKELNDYIKMEKNKFHEYELLVKKKRATLTTMIIFFIFCLLLFFSDSIFFIVFSLIFLFFICLTKENYMFINKKIIIDEFMLEQYFEKMACSLNLYNQFCKEVKENREIIVYLLNKYNTNIISNNILKEGYEEKEFILIKRKL